MPMLRRVRRRKAEEDRLSALPDDLIRVIINNLDTRTALSTALLARRWAHIPHELPALDLRVSDILPPQHNRTVALRQGGLPRDEATATMLDALMSRCESLAMRALVDGVTNLIILPMPLPAQEEEEEGGRRTKTLRLEFFQTSDDAVNRLIAAAVGAWGVTELEVVVLRSYRNNDIQAPPVVYSLFFPDDNDCLLKSRIRSLTLGNHCSALPPDLHSYGALTELVLRDMPASTPLDVYQKVLNECTRLQVLHLTSCRCTETRLDDSIVVLDAPASQLRELVLEECSFMVLDLRDLPMLARLACRLTNTWRIKFGSLPRLTHTNLTFNQEDFVSEYNDRFDQFLDVSPTMANLIVRLDGIKRWIGPKPPDKPMIHLRRLLVGNLPLNWDISWPRGLLMTASSLEVLHIHVPRSEEAEPEYRYGVLLVGFWESHAPLRLRHHCLKELVMFGFQQRHTVFLKYVVSVCTSLRRVVLRKDGHVRYNGLWDWEMVVQQACLWSDEDEMAVRRIISSGHSPLVQLILG
ncbi:hypothetical protein BRADI_5g03666v3 [Brachypodium distachyon]|uniref:F-box domain-containing protein n=1 Tax=Brachypodium distachyon TaxID=15368 RepID=A0A0Q3KPS0_BRADI|nr:hypothetical protein BRADI_5g03666v3 [Brachypodium distachyon]